MKESCAKASPAVRADANVTNLQTRLSHLGLRVCESVRACGGDSFCPPQKADMVTISYTIACVAPLGDAPTRAKVELYVRACWPGAMPPVSI